MALSSTQKHNVVFYLGWSGLTLVTGSTQYNTVVNDRLSDAAESDEISKIVKTLLDCLASTDEKLKAAQCRLAASKVDNLEMNDDEISWLRSERLRYIRELSQTLDIPITRLGSSMVSVVV
jgi:hypothetical protein